MHIRLTLLLLIVLFGGLIPPATARTEVWLTHKTRTLLVQGTSGPDSLILQVNAKAGTLSVVGKYIMDFPLAMFDKVRVLGGEGADFINIVDPTQVLQAQNKQLHIEGGGGENIVVLSHQPFSPQTARAVMAKLAVARQLEALAQRADKATREAFGGKTFQLVETINQDLAESTKTLSGESTTSVINPAEALLSKDLAALGGLAQEHATRAEEFGARHEELVKELSRQYDPGNGNYPADDDREPPDGKEPPVPNRREPGPEDMAATNTRSKTERMGQEALQIAATTRASLLPRVSQMDQDATLIERRALLLEARLEQLGARAEQLAARGEGDMSAASDRIMQELAALRGLDANLRAADQSLRGELGKTLTFAGLAEKLGKLKKPAAAECATPNKTTQTYVGGSGTDFFFPFSAPNSAWSISGGGGTDFLFGGMAGDVISGGDGTDFICGLGGNDQIRGDAGTDLLFGEFIVDLSFFTGNDCIWGGAGTDLVAGDNFLAWPGSNAGGDDNLWGDGGVDILVGDDILPDIFSQSLAGGKDAMEGNDDTDFLLGCGGADDIQGDKGMDFVQGNGGNDVIDGGGGESFSFCYTTVELGNLLLGGDGADTIKGGTGIDVMLGNSGADNLSGKGQLDIQFGGPGNDKMNGDQGGTLCLIPPYNIPVRLGNFMVGGPDDDTMTAAGDLDIMLGSAGVDDLRGYDNSGQVPFALDSDLLIGGPDKDYIEGDKITDIVTSSTDVILGNGGDDVIDAGKFSDLVAGGSGLDTIHGDNNWLPLVSSSDLIFGGEGPDWIDGGTGTDVLLGGQGDDTLWGDNETPAIVSADLVFGNDGRDNINGGCGTDFLSGGDGPDRILGDSNQLFEPLSMDFILGGGGDDYADGGNAADFVFGNLGADTLLGDNSLNPRISKDFLFGGPGDDNMDGGNTTDFIWGGTGNDRILGDQSLGFQLFSLDFLFGEEGCDTIYGGRALDTISGGPGVDGIAGEDGPDLIFGGEHGDTITAGDSLDCVWGNDGNDQIHGDDFVDILDGGAGNDCLHGDGGQDLILGDTGDDCAHGGGHADAVFGGDGNDLLFGDNGPDFLSGGDGNDVLDGGSGPDLLWGGGGSDSAWGGPGVDLMSAESRHQKASSGRVCTCQVEICPGELCITKYHDLNHNGAQDPGEPGLPGWSFTITGTGGTTTAVTGPDGKVCITLPAGTYTVAEQTQAGWINTTVPTQTVNVPGGKVSGVTFGNKRRVPGKGDICITKFEDRNGNGVQDGGEPALPDWNFTVTAANVSTQQLTTGPSGNVCATFSEGIFTVTEQLPTGWVNTTPLSQSVTVTANQQAVVAFGNQRVEVPSKGQICITKFEDLNGNGVQDTGEPGLPGWNFSVTASSGSTTSLTTGADGSICASYAAGAYSVVEQGQSGWINTTPLTVNTLVGPGQLSQLTFGNRRREPVGRGELCITKYYDRNGNGTQDGPEAPLAGWSFTITAADGTSTTVTTGADGTICTTLPAATYTVVEQGQPGWVNTTPATLTTTVTANQTTNLTFGNRPLAPPAKGELCLSKFEDRNGNGRRDGGEPGLGNWSFTIQASGGVPIQVTTDKEGNVCTSLAPGTYTVQELLQNGWSNTTPITQTVVITSNQTSSLTFGNRRKEKDRPRILIPLPGWGGGTRKGDR